MYQAIIFDFDGVILDSEPLHFQACNSATANFIFDFDGTLADSFFLACDILINQAQLEYVPCRDGL